MAPVHVPGRLTYLPRQFQVVSVDVDWGVREVYLHFEGVGDQGGDACDKALWTHGFEDGLEGFLGTAFELGVEVIDLVLAFVAQEVDVDAEVTGY